MTPLINHSLVIYKSSACSFIMVLIFSIIAHTQGTYSNGDCLNKAKSSIIPPGMMTDCVRKLPVSYLRYNDTGILLKGLIVGLSQKPFVKIYPGSSGDQTMFEKLPMGTVRKALTNSWVITSRRIPEFNTLPGRERLYDLSQNAITIKGLLSYNNPVACKVTQRFDYFLHYSGLL